MFVRVLIWVLMVCVMGSLLSLASDTLEPTVMLAVLVRNKEPYLPYLLSRLASLDYPKQRISLWLRSDHNEDVSVRVVQRWLDEYSSLYHSTDVQLNETGPTLFPDETGPLHHSDARLREVTALKEQALQRARAIWADFVWLLDADALLFEDDVLQYLVSLNRSVVAPMLTTHTAYSNFWAGMGDDFYYRRTDLYLRVYNRKEVGCFAVPLVHSCILVDLRVRATRHLTFQRDLMLTPTGPVDDLITFAVSAQQAGLEQTVCNDRVAGQIPLPLLETESLSNERLNVDYIRLEALLSHEPLPVLPVMRQFLPQTTPKSRLGFDHVYMINLARRPDRRKRMMSSLDILGVDAEVFEAVDGRQLNSTFLTDHGIRQLPGYVDPYHNRPLKLGEIGCFLSHYGVWRDALQRGHRHILVLEDDVRFKRFFVPRLQRLMEDVRRLKLDWDLIYLGRKIMDREEQMVNGSELLAHPRYTYWTLGYLLTARGARILLDEKPLSKMVPVDEYLPIMFDQHPNSTWKANFPRRRLRAFSAEPLLLEPVLYVGDEGYVSDTEDSDAVTDSQTSDPLSSDIVTGSQSSDIVTDSQSSDTNTDPQSSDINTDSQPSDINTDSQSSDIVTDSQIPNTVTDFCANPKVVDVLPVPNSCD